MSVKNNINRKLITKSNINKKLKLENFNMTGKPTAEEKNFNVKTGKLSYRQLLRINAVLSAKNNVEKKEANRFVGTLTPPERKVYNQIVNFKSTPSYDLRKNYIYRKLQEKNKEETKNVDVSKLFESLGER